MTRSGRRPNIVIVMADQLAPHFTGACGHPLAQTPRAPCLSCAAEECVVGIGFVFLVDDGLLLGEPFEHVVDEGHQGFFVLDLPAGGPGQRIAVLDELVDELGVVEPVPVASRNRGDDRLVALRQPPVRLHCLRQRPVGFVRNSYW